MIDQKKEIQKMFLARFPLLWVVSPEEEPAEEILCDVLTYSPAVPRDSKL